MDAARRVVGALLKNARLLESAALSTLSFAEPIASSHSDCSEANTLTSPLKGWCWEDGWFWTTNPPTEDATSNTGTALKRWYQPIAFSLFLYSFSHCYDYALCKNNISISPASYLFLSISIQTSVLFASHSIKIDTVESFHGWGRLSANKNETNERKQLFPPINWKIPILVHCLQNNILQCYWRILNGSMHFRMLFLLSHAILTFRIKLPYVACGVWLPFLGFSSIAFFSIF